MIHFCTLKEMLRKLEIIFMAFQVFWAGYRTVYQSQQRKLLPGKMGLYITRNQIFYIFNASHLKLPRVNPA